MSSVNRRRFKKCDLHVGGEKTGSTSLQRFFGLNRAQLLRRGIFIPQSLSPNAASGDLNHIFLTTVSFEGDALQPNDLQRAVGVTSVDQIAQHRRQITEAFALEAAQLPHDVDRLVLSNEHIQSRLRGTTYLESLKNFIQPFCENIRVIVYLRPQHEVAMSAATTALRAGAVELRLIPDFNTENGFDDVLGVNFEYFNYDQFLSDLATIFGDSMVSPRIYDGELLNQNVIDDFFSTIDIDIRGLPYPRRENTNLGKENIAFLLALNQFVDRHPARHSIRDVAIDYFASLDPGNGLRPARATVAKFASLFDLSNEDVRARWFPERSTLFKLDLADFPQRAETVDLTNDDYFDAFCGIIRHVANCGTDSFLLSILKKSG